MVDISAEEGCSMKKVLDKLYHLSYYSVCAAVSLLFLFLFAASMFSTSYVDINNPNKERLFFLKDNVFLSVAMLLCFCVLFILLQKLLDKISAKRLQQFLFVWTLIFGCVFVFSSMSSPTHDSYIVTNTAYSIAKGNINALEGSYFRYYPFQLGYVLMNEIIFRIFPVVGYGAYLLTEVINIVFLAFAYIAITMLSGMLFNNDRAKKNTTLLLILCPQGILFSTFTYGFIPGFTFGIYAILFAVVYLQKDKKIYAVLSAVMIAFAAAIKLNYVIILAAICAVCAVYFVCKRRKWFDLAYIAMAVLMVFGLKQLIVTSYEKRSGLDFGSGIPMISWMAMGLSDNSMGPGWFSGNYTTANFESNGMDADKASEASLEVVKKRVKTFAADIPYAADFFTRKALSQWNEPAYQSIWTNQVRGQIKEKGALAAYICGEGEKKTTKYMEYMQQLIFFASCVAILQLLIKKAGKVELMQLVFPIVILGGFLYHMLFEAKSSYILVYFIMMMPLAANSLNSFYTVAEKHIFSHFKYIKKPKKQK